MDFLSGLLLTPDGFEEGYIAVENGIVEEVCGGRCPAKPSAEGIILPSPVNAHTHCADGAVKVLPGMSIEELVAPPDGLKHRYLKNASEKELELSIGRFSQSSAANGSPVFIDFREGGAKGCALLRMVAPEAVILGRPVSPEFDPEEISDILDIADGIGLSAISDIRTDYAEDIADEVRRKGKMLGIHVSERVREDIDAVLSLDPTFVVHMTEASDGDMLKCAESDVPAVICPGSNAYFGKVPPASRMLECGMEFSLGTDNAMLRTPDLRKEAFIAASLLELGGCNPGYVWKAMAFNSRRLIYGRGRADIRKGGPAEVSVFPCKNMGRPMDALMSSEPVPLYGKKK